MRDAIGLWSLRWSHALGVYWLQERMCDPSVAELWLAQFKRDEPSVTFRLSAKRPKVMKAEKHLARHVAAL